MDSKLTHLDKDGNPTMVDVGHKPLEYRLAIAQGKISLQKETVKLIRANKIQKGNVLVTAELAGIQGAKNTSSMIPLCHNIPLSHVHVRVTLEDEAAVAQAEVGCTGQTGVEMESLGAVSVALLTIYDMCKAVDKKMVIGSVELLKKTKQKPVAS